MPRAPTTPTISNLGDQLDLAVRQGSTLGPLKFTMTNADTTPVDLTGCVIRGTVRRDPTAYGPPAAELVVTIDADPTLGKFTMSIPASVTAAMAVGETISSPESTYYWDAELQDASGSVMPLYYGVFRVQPEATRPDTEAPPAVVGCCA